MRANLALPLSIDEENDSPIVISNVTNATRLSSNVRCKTSTMKAPISSIRFGLYGTVMATLMIFMGWCVIDYVAVRQPDYPVRVHERDWIIFLLPLPAFLACYFCGRAFQVASTFLTSVVATILAVALSIPLIVVLGVWFHFSIGGRL